MKKLKKKAKIKKAKSLKPKRDKKRVLPIEPKQSQGRFHVTIKLNDDVYDTQTDDIFEALFNFHAEKITNKLIFTVHDSVSNKTVERFIYPARARKIFVNSMNMRFFVKNFMMMFS